MHTEDETYLQSEPEQRLPDAPAPIEEGVSDGQSEVAETDLPGEPSELNEDGEGAQAPAGQGGVAAAGKTGGRRAFREVVETVLITLLIFLLVRAVIQNFKVEGDSMLPTLHSEQFLLVNKGLYFRYDANFLGRIFNHDLPSDMRYLFHGPQRGDVIVFESPIEPKDYIKRVIAVEGETVEIKADPESIGRPGSACGDCGVYVNGVKLDEPYVEATPDYNKTPVTVQKGYIYVLGDNRRNSSDSHVWGQLEVSRIIGVAFVSYWPSDRWGFLSHPTYAEIKKSP